MVSGREGAQGVKQKSIGGDSPGAAQSAKPVRESWGTGLRSLELEGHLPESPRANRVTPIRIREAEPVNRQVRSGSAVPVLRGKSRRRSTQHPRGVHQGETSGTPGSPRLFR